MYSTLITLHSLFRWLVLVTLLISIYRAWKGMTTGAVFSRTDNAFRHWTATSSHIQLMIGMILYFQSPLVDYFLKHFRIAITSMEFTFFGIIHSLLMLVAIIVITFGSALAKRKTTDREKFKTMLYWFSIALIILLIAIPWPFSPLANRPYFR